jgi:hypothetical protein
MSWYVLALFVHVSGAIGAGISLGVWLVGLAALRRAQHLEQVRALAWLIIVVSPLMVFSVLLIIGAGLAMTLRTWGLRTNWIAVALIGLVVMAPIGPLVLDARMRVILNLAGATPAGSIPAPLAARIRDPILSTAAQTMAALFFGIVLLMTTKPALAPAIVMMGAALVLGLLSSLPLWRAARGQAQRAARADGATTDPYLKQTFWTRRW